MCGKIGSDLQVPSLLDQAKARQLERECTQQPVNMEFQMEDVQKYINKYLSR